MAARRRRKPNRAEKAEATRANLFEAAIETVGKYGYAGTSIARITERARVAQGTFYNYFESRQDLLDQLLPAISNQLHYHIHDRVMAAPNAMERERARIEAFFEFLGEAPHLFKILSEGPVQAPEGFRRHLQQQTESYRRAMKFELERGNLLITDPDELEVITQMLLSAREYLSARFCFVDGTFTKPPAFVVESYMKFVAGTLFKPPPEAGRTRPKSVNGGKKAGGKHRSQALK
jgi:AcrR family transcriptional regulator